MNSCSKAADAEWKAMLESFFDGELDAVHSLKVETHLADCAGCADEIQRLHTLRRIISQKHVNWRAPDHVRAGVLDALAREAEARHRPTLGRSSRPAASSFSVVNGIRQWLFVPSLAALAACLFLVFGPLQNRRTLEDEIVSSHIRSTLANHLVDVDTSDQHTVKPWFNGKIDFAPPVTDLAAQGFPLQGGRIDYLGGRVVAALIYRRGGHVINLFIWPASTPLAPMTARDGYNLASWVSGGLEFVAVSDTSPDDMNRFHRAFADQTARQSQSE